MIYCFTASPLMSILIIYVLFLMLYVMHIYLVTLRSATFARIETCFLYVITPWGIEVDHAKVEVIHGWPIPKNLSLVQSFLGLAGFYHHFVKDFSTIAAPLNELTKKGVTLLEHMTSECFRHAEK
jgi:hypothetical protein